MAGGSLMPEYYNAKMNVCVFYAPPASLYNNPSTLLETISKPYVLNGIWDIANLTGFYNWIPASTSKKYGRSVCTLFNGAICDYIMSFFIELDPSIDYHPRYDVYMSNLPSGAGYLDYAHYG